MSPGMIPIFSKTLVEEVMPQVEKAYHASNRNQHAIAGLSMAAPAPQGQAGGRGRGPQSMETADFETNFPAVGAKTGSQLKLLWIACGTDDGLNNGNREFKAWLKSKGVPSPMSKFPVTRTSGLRGGEIWRLWLRYCFNPGSSGWLQEIAAFSAR